MLPYLTSTANVEIHLSGWAYAIPVVPNLAGALGFTRPVVGVLDTALPAPERTAAIDFGGIAVPGTSAQYLANAIDDVQEIATILGGSTEVPVEPSLAEVVSLLARSRAVLLAGHAFGSKGDPGDSFFDLGSDKLDVRTILQADLSGTEVVVFSACESLSLDAQLYESPLSLAAATLLAGAGAAVGSHWRVGDGHASSFARQLFRELSTGTSLASAYLTTLRANQPDDPFFTLCQRSPTLVPMVAE